MLVRAFHIDGDTVVTVHADGRVRALRDATAQAAGVARWVSVTNVPVGASSITEAVLMRGSRAIWLCRADGVNGVLEWSESGDVGLRQLPPIPGGI